MKATWIAVLAVPVLLAGPAVFGQPGDTRRGRGRPPALEERGRRRPEWAPGERGGPPPMGPERFRGRRPDMGNVIRLILIAARQTEDAELQELVDKVISDRRKMLRAEKARVDAFEALVNAIRQKDKEGIQAARKDLKRAADRLKALTRELLQDLKQIRDRLQDLHPGWEGRRGVGPHGPRYEGERSRFRQEGRPEGRRERRGRGEDPLEDVF